jgi:hypothetical protein
MSLIFHLSKHQRPGFCYIKIPREKRVCRRMPLGLFLKMVALAKEHGEFPFHSSILFNQDGFERNNLIEISIIKCRNVVVFIFEIVKAGIGINKYRIPAI